MDIKVLVAGSSDKVRKNIARSLQEIGVRDVVEATHTDQAKELLERGVFDIVFAEWNGQPGGVGELVKSVCRYDDNVPIVVTAPQSNSMIDLPQNWPSASTYLTVPFTTEQLRKTIAEYVPSIADDAKRRCDGCGWGADGSRLVTGNGATSSLARLDQQAKFRRGVGTLIKT